VARRARMVIVASYVFVDEWLVPAPIEAVYELLSRPREYPQWWSDAFLEGEGDPPLRGAGREAEGSGDLDGGHPVGRDGVLLRRCVERTDPTPPTGPVHQGAGGADLHRARPGLQPRRGRRQGHHGLVPARPQVHPVGESGQVRPGQQGIQLAGQHVRVGVRHGAAVGLGGRFEVGAGSHPGVRDGMQQAGADAVRRDRRTVGRCGAERAEVDRAGGVHGAAGLLPSVTPGSNVCSRLPDPAGTRKPLCTTVSAVSGGTKAGQPRRTRE